MILPDRCTALVATITPSAPTIPAGDSLSLSVVYTGAAQCLPGVPASVLHWSSSAPGVVAVDSLRGVVTALATGSAVLTVHLPGSMAVLGGTLVTVP